MGGCGFKSHYIAGEWFGCAYRMCRHFNQKALDYENDERYYDDLASELELQAAARVPHQPKGPPPPWVVA
eukprot:709824-Alexandrium_andersonii.AAC.1